MYLSCEASPPGGVTGCGYLSGARCRLAYGPAEATATHCGLTFLVPAHLGSPGKKAVKRVCVCVWILKITPHLAYVDTLPCWTLMSAKQAINDKLRDCVATYNKKGLQVEKNKISEYFAKLQARAWLSHALCAPGQHTAKRRRKFTRLPRSCLQICQIFTDWKMALSDSAEKLFSWLLTTAPTRTHDVWSPVR